MVWGVIACNRRSPIVLLCGTMAAQLYAYDILQPHTVSLKQWFPGAIFQQDNARPHTARFQKTVSALLLPSLPCPIPKFISN
ncbi:uncharacterized protein TNCV_2668561 [Trichonephila clavipes]|nr:uncharacterized protein TNCV_2668561 [Trichonephila clavipes]